MMIHNNEIVSIEEVLIKSQNYYQHYFSRKFIFSNRSTNLKLSVHTSGAIIDSCELNGHQIIVANNEHRNNESQWNSHVFGFDTLSLSSQDTSQRHVVYQLTKNNEFIVEGKDFNRVLQPFQITSWFFNLNSVDDKPNLDDHYLHVRASHESINVFTDSNAVVSQFINSVPLLIPDYLEGSDFVCTTNSSQIPNASIIATLSYSGRAIEVFLEAEQWTASHLRILIKNGSIAFVPHNMSKFRITYKFYW